MNYGMFQDEGQWSPRFSHAQSMQAVVPPPWADNMHFALDAQVHFYFPVEHDPREVRAKGPLFQE